VFLVGVYRVVLDEEKSEQGEHERVIVKQSFLMACIFPAWRNLRTISANCLTNF